MSDAFSQQSDQLADAVESAARFVLQVHSHRRPTAGVLFDSDLVMAPARAIGDDAAVVRHPDGHTLEGNVLGFSSSHGLAVIRFRRHVQVIRGVADEIGGDGAVTAAVPDRLHAAIVADLQPEPPGTRAVLAELYGRLHRVEMITTADARVAEVLREPQQVPDRREQSGVADYAARRAWARNRGCRSTIRY